MRPHHRQRRDVAVRNAVGGLFLHFGEHVADDLGRVVGGLGGPGDLGDVLVGRGAGGLGCETRGEELRWKETAWV